MSEEILVGIKAQVPSPLEIIHDERLDRCGLRLYLKRDDLIHPAIPGNKWRKLKYNLSAARDNGDRTLLTFGGAYSNHIRATAAAGAASGFATIGVIRGEAHQPLNDSLADATSQGMRLLYMDRTTYRYKTDPAVIQKLHDTWGAFYLIPEGGSNSLGVKGCTEIVSEIAMPFDIICCSVGTGATLAGIAAGLKPGQTAIGFSALKGGQFLQQEVERLRDTASSDKANNWTIETDFHFGGYAKTTPELQAFIADFEKRHGVRLDETYEAKMMYGLFALTEQGRIPSGNTIIAAIAG